MCTNPTQPNAADDLTLPITGELLQLQQSQVRALTGTVTGLGWDGEDELERREHEARQSSARRHWRTMTADLLDCPDKLSEWERNFLDGIRQREDITPKQVKVLARIDDTVFGEDRT